MSTTPRAWARALPAFASASRKAWRAFKEDRLPLSPAWWWRALILHLRSEHEVAAGVRSGPGRFDRERLNASYVRAIAERTAVSPPAHPSIPLSVICLTPEPADVSRLIESVRAQSMARWELWLVETSAGSKSSARQEDDRIKRHVLEQRVDGTWLPPGTHSWLVLLDGSSVLQPDALANAAEAAVSSRTDWIYTDTVTRDAIGGVTEPELKGNFSSELALVDDYATRLAIVSRECITRAGGLKAELGAAQLHDLLLRAAETGATVTHLPVVCCHRAATTRHEGTETQRRVIQEALDRRGVNGEVVLGPDSSRRLRWRKATGPVTIVIPVRNRAHLLRACLRSLTNTVSPESASLAVVDDDSTEPELLALLEDLPREVPFECRVIRVPDRGRDFNYARLMNAAVGTVNTPLVLQLNNDVRAIEPGWLAQMAGWFGIDRVGIVGARLLNTDDTVQHAGIVLREGAEPEHLFTGLSRHDSGYLHLASRARNVAAVTGACMLSRTALYAQLGGFDETRFPVQFGDVDYCLRAADAGWRTVYEPAATLYHDGSATRGGRYDPAENAAYLSRHGHRRDPFHSPLLDPSSLTGPTPVLRIERE